MAIIETERQKNERERVEGSRVPLGLCTSTGTVANRRQNWCTPYPLLTIPPPHHNHLTPISLRCYFLPVESFSTIQRTLFPTVLLHPSSSAPVKATLLVVAMDRVTISKSSQRTEGLQGDTRPRGNPRGTVRRVIGADWIDIQWQPKTRTNERQELEQHSIHRNQQIIASTSSKSIMTVAVG